MRRRAKSRDSSISAEGASKLQNAEVRLTELKSTMVALGREATAAMQSVEAQQQQVTYERLRTMVLLHYVQFAERHASPNLVILFGLFIYTGIH